MNTRDTTARPLALAAAILLGVGVWAAPALADTGADEPESPEICTEAVTITWTATSHLYSTSSDVERDPKTIDYDGDVAIDGWASGVPRGEEGVGVDGWGDGGVANFRAVIGTTVPLENASASIAVENGTLLSIGEPYTPAGGATPDRYKVLPVDPLPLVQGEVGGAEIALGIGEMPAEGPEAGSSLGLNFSVDPTDRESTETPVTVTLTVTGDATVIVDCPEPPVETTEPPVETTEPPVETTEPPVETSEPPVDTADPQPIPTQTQSQPKQDRPLAATGAQNFGALAGAAVVLLGVGALALGLGRTRKA